MRIELCEDNGVLNGGKPTLVIVLIDGKQRIPYPADKTIQQLYEDVGKIPLVLNNEIIQPLNLYPGGLDYSRGEPKEPFEGKELKPGVVHQNPWSIEREDIVRCIKAYEREGNNDLKVGDQYRVIDIKKYNGRVEYYEVLDDNAPAKYRIKVAPEEIELLRKAPPKEPKNNNYKDIIKRCSCGTENALVLIGDRYEGLCTKCQCSLIEQLPNNGGVK